jgi:cytochrome c-type biogenesis protein CcmH
MKKQLKRGCRLVKALLLLISFSLISVFPSYAAIEELEFSSKEDRERYKKLTDELRCPMCMNSNLSGSDAPIAADLREEIYSQISKGNSDAEIIDFMQARYGDFILYQPPLNKGTLLLWFGPIILLLLGILFIRKLFARSVNNAIAALSPAEEAQLQALLDDGFINEKTNSLKKSS